MTLGVLRGLCFSLLLLITNCFAQLVPQLTPVGVPQLWQRSEFRVTNIPAAANPFDPDVIRVDASFAFPSGRTMTVPAFWYQGYNRTLSGGSESLSLSGSPEWRVRFTPPEAGTYSISVTVLTNHQFWAASSPMAFSVATNVSLPRTGYVRVSPANQYFETGDGQPLRLIGENVCWPGSRGTYDYDTWFSSMQNVGENFARLWMCPWAFGLEAASNSLTRYRLDKAWQLDYVVGLAEQRGIYLLLCLDYHGMFETQPDYWGGNNYWPLNPYNITNGGPCLNQNGFFTNGTAQVIYQKRLRYLVGRYGYSQNLLAWEFFNEIDNVYSYLKPNDVAAWHNVMGGWLRTNDSFGHLVTTSLTGSSDRPELWSVPTLGFAVYHSYGESSPAARLNQVAQSFLSRYRKPVMIGEFGTDWRGWNESSDPYLRGFRQGIWGGALSGSVGTSMSWWWENIQNENLYLVYSSLGTILNRTGWGRGAWTNAQFLSSGSPPVAVGNPVPGGVPFTVFLPLSSVWGELVSGQLAIANPSSADYSASALNSFVHGSGHSDLRVPFRLSAWLTNNARIVMHLNSVSGGAIISVRVDGVELYRTNLPNIDGTWNVNNEYNADFPVALPSGKHTIDITNPGVDWFYLDWVRLENVFPASYSPSWVPSPVATGLRGTRESLLYAVAPGASFPAGATNSNLPLEQNQTIALTNWPAGPFNAEWYDPRTGTNMGFSTSRSTNGVLTLVLPNFREDVAAIVYPPPILSISSSEVTNSIQLSLASETGGRYRIQTSSNRFEWIDWLLITNTLGNWHLEMAPVQPQDFFKAVK